MSNSIDLQISEADLKDPQSIVGILKTWAESDMHAKEDRMKGWMEALNFFAGNQWIKWSERDRRFEPIPTTDANRIIDRPVTNHILRWVTASVSRFTNKPSIIVDPNSEEMADKTSAKICECVKDYLWEEQDKDTQYLEAALWGTICGTVFRKSFKKYTDRYIDLGQDKAQVRVVDSDIVSPFQITFDGLPKKWRDVGTIMHTQVKRVDDIKRQFAVDAPGYFPEAAEALEEEEIVSSAMTFAEGLKNIVDGDGTYRPTAGTQNDLKGCAIYKEAYVRPTRQYPKGLMLCSAGDQLLYFGESPYFYLEGKIWHPFTSWTWTTMPGSIWGIGLVQQLVKLQRRINSIDALVAYNRKTMAIPGWWAPSGCNVPEGSFVGIPGQVKNYDETPGGGKPFPHQGVPLPTQVLDERNMILQDGDRIALAGDIRSGENPKGVNTLGQLQILTEQAELSQAKTVDAFEKFIERSETLDLQNFKDTYQAPDPAMVKSFKKYSKDITASDWDTFTGNEIRDNSTVRVEKGSTISKSRLLRQSTLMRLARMGFFPDLFTDPYQYKKFLEEFGMSEMYKDSNIDVKYAEKAIEMMLAGNYPPVLPEVHNADVQLPVLMRYMKDPKYLELDPKIQILFEQRHKELVAALVAAGPVAPPPDMMEPPAEPSRPGNAAAGKDMGEDIFSTKGAF